MLHGKFYGFDAAEGVLNDLGIFFLEEILESLSVDGLLGEPVRDWSLVSWDLAFGGDFGGHWGVATAKLGFCFGNLVELNIQCCRILMSQSNIKKPSQQQRRRVCFLVRVEGLEPPCLAALDPKSSASTNFATPAFENGLQM